MGDNILTAERILDTAEDVLRRYGPAKATVLDVARALGVSHGSVYRHFASKTALRDAVAQRWLHRVSAPLDLIAAADTAAPERLARWLHELSTTKRRMAADDPELFATFHQIAAESRDVVTAHLATLAGQIARIIADGIARGEFTPTDPAVSGRAVLHATARFHHPAHAGEWAARGIDADLDAVITLLLCGLTHPPDSGARGSSITPLAGQAVAQEPTTSGLHARLANPGQGQGPAR